jgi:hypothetical protein
MAQVTDAQSTFDWAIWLPSVPGGSYSTRDFTFRCTGTTIPAVTQEAFKVEAHGLGFNYPGRRIWAADIDFTVYETRDQTTRNLMLAWMDFVRDIKANTGNYKANYAVDAELNLYDAPGNITKRIKIEQFYPLELGTATLDNTSGLLTYTCKFSMDRTSEIAG